MDNPFFVIFSQLRYKKIDFKTLGNKYQRTFRIAYVSLLLLLLRKHSEHAVLPDIRLTNTQLTT